MKELEREAMTLYRQYGIFLPAPVRQFLHKLADNLNWTDLKGLMK